MSQSDLCVSVWDWLCVLRLEQYSEAFRDAGLATLRECRNLTSDQLERMGITLPGHRRRILASLHKTHLGHPDTHAPTQSDAHSERAEGEQGEGEVVYSKPLKRERPVPVPVGERPVPKEREKREGDGEAARPTPREREKPVPRERIVSRMKEESGEGGERMPVLKERPAAPGGGKEGERDGGIDGERERPVPKERTKYRSTPPADSHPNPLFLPTSDPPLPPIPPRSTPNCPPQRFTSALSPSSPVRTPTSPKLGSRAAQTPVIPSRSPPQSSTPTHTPTHTPLHPPSFPSSQTRPETLAFQQGGSDGGRKTSPISPTASLSSSSSSSFSSSSSSSSAETNEDRSAPPLPPKVGAGPKGPPPVPRRLPIQPARTTTSHR
ncbi:uncharacterized protein LOC139931613 [Centroberyx gerrardi]